MQQALDTSIWRQFLKFPNSFPIESSLLSLQETLTINMAEEDWGAMSNGTQSFSLFRKVSPEDAAQKDIFIDVVIYNRWSKAERRLFQRLKAEQIAKKIEQEQIESIEDIVNSLDQLALIKSSEPQNDSKIDDLISTLEGMKLKADGR